MAPNTLADEENHLHAKFRHRISSALDRYRPGIMSVFRRAKLGEDDSHRTKIFIQAMVVHSITAQARELSRHLPGKTYEEVLDELKMHHELAMDHVRAAMRAAAEAEAARVAAAKH